MVIPDDALAAVRDKAFFDPCAGADRAAALHALAHALAAFRFCDRRYSDATTAAADMPPGFALAARRVERREPVRRSERWQRPRCRVREMYVARATGHVVVVDLWRDRAEELLVREFAGRSIGVFVQRTGGDGDPVALCRFGALAPRLADGAVVLTDGSPDGRIGRSFDERGFRWTCIGHLGAARGWRVERIAAARRRSA